MTELSENQKKFLRGFTDNKTTIVSDERVIPSMVKRGYIVVLKPKTGSGYMYFERGLYQLTPLGIETRDALIAEHEIESAKALDLKARQKAVARSYIRAFNDSNGTNFEFSAFWDFHFEIDGFKIRLDGSIYSNASDKMAIPVMTLLQVAKLAQYILDNPIVLPTE